MPKYGTGNGGIPALAGFGVALFLPFACTEIPPRAASARIARIVDRANVHRLDLAVRRLPAHLRNTRQIARFSSVNRRVAGSSPARGANPSLRSVLAPRAVFRHRTTSRRARHESSRLRRSSGAQGLRSQYPEQTKALQKRLHHAKIVVTS